MKSQSPVSRWIIALAAAALSADRARRRRSRSRSTTRSRSAGRSPRSSTSSPPISRRKIPAIKVHPIYSGTYQDSITKALTAVKSNDAPAMSVLLSTDMYTLIDEDAIVPWDPLIKTAEDRAWLQGFYPAFMENSQTGGKTWGIPFQRSTIVLYYNKEMFKEAGLDPNHPPATWKEMAEYAQKLTKRDAVGQGHAVGRADPGVGVSLLAVPGPDDRKRRAADECRRNRDLL